jgi:hypothetical protein
MKPEDVSLLFTDLGSNFEPIIGQPSDSDIVKMRENISEVLYQIPYDDEKGEHNLVGLIQDKESYTVEYKSSFPNPKKPGIYDSTIIETTKDAVRDQKEAIHKAKRQDYDFFEAEERGTHQFIMTVVTDTYIRELKSPKFFYTNIKPKALLTYLQSMCGGLHALDVLALQEEMHNAHKDSDGIPEYINTLEDGRDKAERAGAPITNNMLIIIATKAMITSEQFPRANDDWEEIDVDDKTWSVRKKLYRAAAKKASIKAKASGGRDQFGAAHAAMMVLA